MADLNDKRPQNKDLDKKEQQELEDILDHIAEVDERPSQVQTDAAEHKPAPEEIIKKPEGAEAQPEDLEGLLDKISEAPETPVPTKKVGFWQKIVIFFTGK